MLKSFKIQKRDYVDYEYLLKRLGAVVDQHAFPQVIYWNKKDLDKSKKLLIKDLKKDCPYTPHKKALLSVGMYMLNLSPVCLEGNPLKDGYMLVDINEINELKEEHEKEKTNKKTVDKSSKRA